MLFDEHANGQLRLGVAGEQLAALPLPASEIPASDGPALGSPALEELQRARECHHVSKFSGLSCPECASMRVEFRSSLARSEELTGEAFKACALACRLVGDGALDLPLPLLELLERERLTGRKIDAHEAARALRVALEGLAR